MPNYLTLKTSGWSAFANGFVPSKFSNPVGGKYVALTDAGSSISVGSLGRFKVFGSPDDAAPGVARLLDQANGVLFDTLAFPWVDARQVRVRCGWAVQGILAIECVSATSDPISFGFDGYTTGGNAPSRGVVTRDFTSPVSGTAQRIYTHWSNNNGGLDTPMDSFDQQVTRTLVPILGTQATAAAGDPLIQSLQGAFESYTSTAQPIGFTFFLQWGNASVSAVQDWIVANLEESETRPFPAPLPVVNTLANAGTPITAYGWPTTPQGTVVATKTLTYDPFDGGNFRIAGTVAIDDSPDIPVRRRVRLFHKLSGRLVRETWSAEDGSYEFRDIANDTYLVVAHDHTLQYNAAVKDSITPELQA